PDHTLSLHSLVAADDFVFIEPGHDAHADFSDVYLWARGQSRFGPNVNLETVVSIGKLWEKGQDDANSPEGVQYAHHTKTYRFYDIKQSVEIRPNSRWRAAWGWSVRNDETQMAFLGAGEVYFLLSPTYDTYRTHRLDADYSLRGKHKSVFTSHQMTVNDRLSTEIGLRYDIVDLSDDNLWSPRVSARYQLGTKTALRAAWGFYFQPQESYQLDIQDDSLVFSDAERSEHVIAEFEQGLGQSAMLALRGYRKITDNPRPRYRDWANRIDLYDELLASSYRIACDHAVSEGLELSLQSSEQATLTWQASYTLARFTEHVTDVTFLSFRPRQLNDDRPSPFDQRHTVYLDAEYRLSPIWQINVAWQYHSGRPYSKPQFNWDYYDNPDVSFYDLGELNAERYPASHRLDLRITRSFTSSWGRFAAFLEVINLYDHQNVRAYSYDVVNYGENDYRLLTKTWYWLGIVPSVGIRWTWGG
ncbi:MAG: hypothetical protein KKA42_00935, partial [candidate division Zixibacteria bacterium]|nr:hypothetical protein [candidate division Zixibacteria bacterium]